jgi:hypothetical protein
MTTKALLTLIREGVGQGHLDEYTPFIRLSRSNISRVGCQSTGILPGYRRESHFVSETQRLTALILLWLSLLDIRESYPLWPFQHPHPLFDWPLGCPVTQMCIGLTHAGAAKYGELPLSRALRSQRSDTVRRVDLMVTTGSMDRPKCVLVCCAPIKQLARLESKSKRLIHLELCRRYADANGMQLAIIDPTCFSTAFVRNIYSLSLSVNAIRRDISDLNRARVSYQLSSDVPRFTIEEAIARAATRTSVASRDVWSVFDYLVWTQEIDVDITRPLYHTEPAVSGGRRVRAELRRLYFGETA